MQQASPATDVGIKRLSTTVAVALLIVVSLSYVTNAMDRSLYPQLLPYINKSYGFSLVQGGFLSTIFALGMGLGGLPAGYLIDRLSRKSTTILGIFIYSLFTLVNVWAFNFWDMSAYRVLTGVGEALQQTALFAMAGAFFYQYRTAAIGSLNVAYGLGSFLGPVLGMQMFLRSGERWQVPLMAYGVLGLAFCVIIAVVVPKVFTEAKGVTQKVFKVIVEDHLPTHLVNRNLVLVSLANVMSGLATFGYLGLYPTYLKGTLHYAPAATALCASMYGIGAFMGLPAGYLGDKLNQKWVVTLAAAGTMVVNYFMFNLATAISMQVFLSFLQGTLSSGFLFVNIYSLTQKSVRKSFLGRASGVASSAHYLPAAFSGLLLGWLISHLGWGGASKIQLVLFPVITVICMLMFDNNKTSRLVPIATSAPSPAD